MTTTRSARPNAVVAAVILLAGTATGFSQDPEIPTEPQPAQAAPAPLTPENCLPVPLDQNHFTAIKTQSPFTRELNLSATYAIRAIATIGETKVATLYNRNTKKTQLVFPDQINETGMKLVEVLDADEPLKVEAKIALGEEVFDVKYDQNQTSVAARGSGGSSSKSGDSQRRGPSKEDIERYKSLSEDQRNKFREYIRYTMQKYPNLSREERGNMIRGAMTKILDGRDLNMEPLPQNNSSGGGGGSSDQPRQMQIRTSSGGGGDARTTIRVSPGSSGGDRRR
ncbi:MAG: hypothetical protein HKN23_12400 [Verrucomicrobiales bacterium]|nr:hypothetical protein [Verrucomicrobiales bacterium]